MVKAEAALRAAGASIASQVKIQLVNCSIHRSILLVIDMSVLVIVAFIFIFVVIVQSFMHGICKMLLTNIYQNAACLSLIRTLVTRWADSQSGSQLIG